MNLGSALKQLRLDTAFGQKDFAEKIGVTQTYISLIERGKKVPSMDVIRVYGDICKKPVAIILWMAITEKDVAPAKKGAFNILKPVVDVIINQMF